MIINFIHLHWIGCSLVGRRVNVRRIGSFIFIRLIHLAILLGLSKFEALFAPIPQTEVWGYKYP